MVEREQQQVNDDDVTDLTILSAKAAKVTGQLEMMVEMHDEESFFVAESIAVLVARVEAFNDELLMQSPIPFVIGGIPQMPEVP